MECMLYDRHVSVRPAGPLCGHHRRLGDWCGALEYKVQFPVFRCGYVLGMAGKCPMSVRFWPHSFSVLLLEKRFLRWQTNRLLGVRPIGMYNGWGVSVILAFDGVIMAKSSKPKGKKQKRRSAAAPKRVSKAKASGRKKISKSGGDSEECEEEPCRIGCTEEDCASHEKQAQEICTRAHRRKEAESCRRQESRSGQAETQEGWVRCEEDLRSGRIRKEAKAS